MVALTGKSERWFNNAPAWESAGKFDDSGGSICWLHVYIQNVGDTCHSNS